jgi:hypothetical protein
MTDPWAKLCKDRPCVRCGADDGTIVPAHANQQRLGKGMGLKAEPWTVIPLCHKCHTWLDNGQANRLELLEAYTHGWNRHMANLLADGLIELRGVEVPVFRPRRKKANQPAYERPSKSLPHPGVVLP